MMHLRLATWAPARWWRAVGATYPCTWRKVRERNASGSFRGAWREMRRREGALALRAAQYQQGILPAWLQAITTATAPSVKWHDPTPVIGFMDEGLHYRQMLDRLES